MDDPDADPELLGNALRFLRRVNRFFGYTRATLAHLRGFSRRWKPRERIRILDLGTGSADIPLAILSWAERAGFDVHVVGLDLHARTVAAAARQATGNPRLKIVCGDVLEMPLADGAFDYALANMFLHHLDDEQVVEVLRRMDALATRGIIFADLIRSRSAYHAVRLSTMLSNRMVRHDAARSIVQAFTEDEVISLRDRAGVGYARFHRHFGHRFVLAGEKTGAGAEI
jgi:SAM-dependent methyltransferase